MYKGQIHDLIVNVVILGILEYKSLNKYIRRLHESSSRLRFLLMTQIMIIIEQFEGVSGENSSEWNKKK